MFLFSLIVGLALGAAVALTIIYMRSGSRAFPKRETYESRWRQLALPVGIAAVVSVLAWTGLGLLFSPFEPETVEVVSSVSQPVGPALSEDIQAPLQAMPVTGESAPENGPARTASPEPESPLSAKALLAAPRFADGESVGSHLRPSATAQPPAEPAAPPATPPAAGQEATPKSPPPQPASPKAATTASGNHYTLHLASFGEKENADKALQRLKAARVPAGVQAVQVNARTYYRLLVSGFSSKAKATAFGQDLKKRGLLEGMGNFVVKPSAGAD